MEKSKELVPTDTIYNRVYMIRGQQVMLDYELAEFSGAIISISHDRKYMDEVCDVVYRLTESGLEEWEN